MEEDEPESGGGAKGPDDASSVPPPGSPAARPETPSLRPSLTPPLPVHVPRSANYRIAFAFLWLLVQIVLIVTADRRPDGAFGFRMFAESSTVKISLFRELADASGHRTRVHVDGGVWNAAGREGMVRRMSWYDRVPSPAWPFDQEIHASYGARAQLVRLQGALDDIATHFPDDAETRRFVLLVTLRRNGREPVTHELVSPERPLPGGAGGP